MRTTTLLLIILISLMSACKTREAVNVDLSNACAADNEKKYLSTTAYLDPGGSVFCSNTGGRMDCSLDAVANTGGPRVFGAEIQEGSGANTIEKLESGYKLEEIKIHDNAGLLIKLTDKVRLT